MIDEFDLDQDGEINIEVNLSPHMLLKWKLTPQLIAGIHRHHD